MAETSDVIRWMEQTQDLTPEGIVDLERRAAPSIAALHKLYDLFQLKDGAAVLRDLWVPDPTGGKAVQLQKAVQDVQAVSKRHEQCGIATDSMWPIQRFMGALTQKAFSWLRAGADSRAQGEYVFKQDVQTAMTIDRRIAMLQCRATLDYVFRPRMTEEDRQRILALADDETDADAIKVTYGQCVDVYRAFPLRNGDLEAAIRLASEASMNKDVAGAAECWREFLRLFSTFAVVEETVQ